MNQWRTVDHEEKFVEIDDRTQPLVPIEVVHIGKAASALKSTHVVLKIW